MSTSHYSSTYRDITSPSRIDDYPEPGIGTKTHPSILHSRPEAGDVGAETIRLPLPTRIDNPKRPLSARWFMLACILMMVADGAGLLYFCDSFWECTVFCCLTLPAGWFTLWCAWEIYAIEDNEDWTH